MHLLRNRNRVCAVSLHQSALTMPSFQAAVGPRARRITDREEARWPKKSQESFATTA